MSKHRRSGRVLATGLAVAALAGLLVPTAGAQKVANPGPFRITPQSGSMALGDTPFDLTPRALPECSDGIDNDGDGRIDEADPGCVAGPNGEPASADDSEAAGGFQPKEETDLSGTIDADGNITIPESGVSFPTAYIPLDVLGNRGIIRANVVATHPAVGVLDPVTGEATLRVRLKVNIRGGAAGVSVGYSCSIGTSANPIDINFTTGVSTAPDGSVLQGAPLVGSTLRVVSRDFAVPGATNCGDAPFYLLNGVVNSEVGLPSGAGNNFAILTGSVDPTPMPVTTTTQPTTTTTTTQPTTTTTTTTTTEPTTTTTTTEPTTTTTTTEPTTTTTTTEPTTTTSTTTTTEPTTTTSTTSTTIPGASGDAVSVALSGGVDYEASGLLDAGDFRIGTRGGRVAFVRGAGSIVGPDGGSARISARMDRVAFFDLWVGMITITDRASGVRSMAGFIGVPRVSGDTISGRAFSLQQLSGPPFFAPVDVTWSITDAD